MIIVSAGWFLGRILRINHLLLLLSIIFFEHILLFYSMKYYADFIERGFWKELKLTFSMSAILFVSLKVVEILVLPENFFRLNLLMMTACYFILLLMTNAVMRYIVWHLRQGYQPGNEKYIYTLSNKDNLAKLTQIFKKLDPSIKVIGKTVLGANNENLEELIPEEQMLDYITRNVVDSVYIYLSDITEEDLNHYVSQFEQFGIDINIVFPPTRVQTNGKRTLLLVDSYPILNSSMTNYSQLSLALSKFIDVVAAICGLFICAVCGFFIAIFIKLEDNGPIFFVQDRIGRNGRTFKFYKFRSMRIDAEQQKEYLVNDNQVKGNMFKIAGDPRITKVGNFIRKTSLDELPQFYNILRGDMSLVGTRPPLISEYENYTAAHKRRLSFKLGLTGNWQVSGRNNIQDFDEVVKLDVDYIENWSIFLDLKIILKTFYTVLLRKGAL